MQSVYLQRIMKKNANMGYEKTKPKQTQFAKRVKLMQNLYLQRIMKKIAAKGYEKQSQTNPIQIGRQKRNNGTFYAAHPTYIIELCERAVRKYTMSCLS